MNLLAIGATSWLLATLELRVGPEKLFCEYGPPTSIGSYEHGRFIYFGLLLPGKKTSDEFRSKFFAETITKGLEKLFDWEGENLKPSQMSSPREIDAKKVAYSPNALGFAKNLFIEVHQQREAVRDSIEKHKQGINNSDTFGEALVKRLHKTNPHLARLDYKPQLKAVKEMIKDRFNVYQQTVADDYFFFGNDPPCPLWDIVKLQLEKQLWAVWVFQQHFRVKGYDVYGKGGRGETDVHIEGASGRVLDEVGGIGGIGVIGHELKDSPIVTHLWERCNAPVMDIILHGPPTTRKEAEEQVDRLNSWAVQDLTLLRGQLKEEKRELKPIDHIWD